MLLLVQKEKYETCNCHSSSNLAYLDVDTEWGLVGTGVILRELSGVKWRHNSREELHSPFGPPVTVHAPLLLMMTVNCTV